MTVSPELWLLAAGVLAAALTVAAVTGWCGKGRPGLPASGTYSKPIEVIR